MSAHKTIHVCGLAVRIYDQSFMVEGVPQSVWLGPSFTDRVEDTARMLIDGIYAKALAEAREDAAEEIAQKIRHFLTE